MATPFTVRIETRVNAEVLFCLQSNRALNQSGEKILECNAEMIAVELSLAESPNVIISVFYRPPNNNASFIDEFDTFLSNTSGLPKTKLLLLGDFNFPNICCLENDVSLTSDESAFCEILKDHFLQKVNFNPTRVSTMTLTAKIIYLIITNEPDSIANI